MNRKRRSPAAKKNNAARKGGRSSVPRSLGTGLQMCKVQETVPYQDLLPNQSYNLGFVINNFIRAAALCPYFRWMKPTKVTWKIEPLYNTFQEGTATNLSIPYLYTVMNRTQDSRPQVLNDYQASGAQPRKLTAPIVISYVPNWCSMGLALQDQSTKTIAFTGLKAQYGWSQCPRDVPVQTTSGGSAPLNVFGTPYGPTGTPINYPGGQLYNGHDVYIDQEFSPTVPAACARVTATVDWSFKDPASFTGPRVTVSVPTIEYKPPTDATAPA